MQPMSVPPTTELSRNMAEQTWQRLQRGLSGVQLGRASDISYADLYQNAYTLVLHKRGAKLYNGVSKVIQQRLESVHANLRVAEQTEEVLPSVLREWRLHQEIMRNISDVLLYMDSKYCRMQNKPVSRDMSYMHFGEYVLKPRYGQLRDELLRRLRQERQGERLEDALQIKDALQMLVEVELGSFRRYDMHFETPFLEETRNFFCARAEDVSAHNSPAAFVKQLLEWIDTEEKHCEERMAPKTLVALRHTLNETLVRAHYRRICADGCPTFFDNDQISDLRLLYNLCVRLNSSKDGVGELPIAEALAAWIKKQGESIRALPETEWAARLILLKRRTARYVVCNNAKIATARKQAFERFVNVDSKMAKQLASFVDAVLSGKVRISPVGQGAGQVGPGPGQVGQGQLDEVVDDITDVFRFVKDNDVFEEYYKKHLARRLLTGHANEDKERQLIAKLQTECGAQFLEHLKTMLLDMHHSNDLLNEFRGVSATKLDFDLSVSVLQQGAWPFRADRVPVNLPPTVRDCFEHYRHFYCQQKHPNRRLKLATGRGQAEVLIRFPTKAKLLVVSTWQMCVLSLFNHKTVWSFGDICAQLQIPAEALEPHLLSLVHPDVAILLKRPGGRSLESSHELKLNAKFENPRYRVPVPLLTFARQRQQEQKKVDRSIKLQRRHVCDAAVVRIMKSRKTMMHQDLVGEVLRQLSTKFQVEIALIKKRIEELIEQEFLRRDEQDRRKYHYCA